MSPHTKGGLYEILFRDSVRGFLVASCAWLAAGGGSLQAESCQPKSHVTRGMYADLRKAIDRKSVV